MTDLSIPDHDRPTANVDGVTSRVESVIITQFPGFGPSAEEAEIEVRFHDGRTFTVTGIGTVTDSSGDDGDPT